MYIDKMIHRKHRNANAKHGMNSTPSYKITLADYRYAKRVLRHRGEYVSKIKGQRMPSIKARIAIAYGIAL